MKYRKKVIVIPYIMSIRNCYLMMVKDRVHDEWTFVTGGCKPHESYRSCAVRELFEETNGALCLMYHDLNIDKFQSFLFNNEILDDGVILTYKVYFIPLHRFGYDVKSSMKLENKYIDMACYHKEPEFQETSALKFFHTSSLAKLRNMNVWSFMKERVFDNENFKVYFKDVLSK